MQLIQFIKYILRDFQLKSGVIRPLKIRPHPLSTITFWIFKMFSPTIWIISKYTYLLIIQIVRLTTNPDRARYYPGMGNLIRKTFYTRNYPIPVLNKRILLRIALEFYPFQRISPIPRARIFNYRSVWSSRCWPNSLWTPPEKFGISYR